MQNLMNSFILDSIPDLVGFLLAARIAMPLPRRAQRSLGLPLSFSVSKSAT
jgi:hypothetical protein